MLSYAVVLAMVLLLVKLGIMVAHLNFEISRLFINCLQYLQGKILKINGILQFLGTILGIWWSSLDLLRCGLYLHLQFGGRGAVLVFLFCFGCSCSIFKKNISCFLKKRKRKRKENPGYLHQFEKKSALIRWVEA